MAILDIVNGAQNFLMPVTKQSGSRCTPEEEIEILNNRLLTSTYMEDKMAALGSLYRLSLQAPVSVGTIALHSIFQSIETIGSSSSQLKILRNVVSGSLREEFTELLFSRTENTQLLLQMEPQLINELFRIFDTEFFFRQLSKEPSCAQLIVSLCEADSPEFIPRLLSCNPELSAQLVFNSVLETTLNKLSQKKTTSQTTKAHKELILSILHDSIVAQDYFIESALYNSPVFYDKSSADVCCDIFSELLDPENPQFHKMQQFFLIPRFVHWAVLNKHYKYISLLLKDNLRNTEEITQKYLNRELLIEDAETLQCAFHILEDATQLLHGPVSTHSYRILLLLSTLGLGLSAADIRQQVIEDIKAGKVTEDLMGYILFTYDSIDDIRDILPHETYPGRIKQLCTLLFTIHGVPIKDNAYAIINQLRLLRASLCDQPLISIRFSDSLIADICEVIKDKQAAIVPVAEVDAGADATVAPMVVFEQQAVETEKEEHSSPLETLQTNITQFGRSSYRKFTDTFNFLKKDSKESNQYDL